MKYIVKITENGEPVSCVPETLRQDGEIYFSVFDGSANITIETNDAVEAINKAKEIYKRSLWIE